MSFFTLLAFSHQPKKRLRPKFNFDIFKVETKFLTFLYFFSLSFSFSPPFYVSHFLSLSLSTQKNLSSCIEYQRASRVRGILSWQKVEFAKNFVEVEFEYFKDKYFFSKTVRANFQ